MSEEIRPEETVIPKEAQAPQSGERRTFLKLAVGAMGACYAGAIGYPVYRYIASPVENAAAAGAVNEVTLDKVLDIPKNSALMFKFGSQPSMLIRHEDDTWSALSAVCTHLGCTAGYQPDTKQIFCPCHNGVYDPRTGGNISGPPPKPLTAYKVSVADGKAVVTRA
jgi:cytochrome b6-f complex iron-sulfur subunit